MSGSAPFSMLRRLSSRQKTRAAPRCELCGTVLAMDHPHLAEPGGGKIVCSCLACSLLFPARPGIRFKRVPRDILAVRDSDEMEFLWSGLSIPIGLAFFIRSSAGSKVTAFYPSPAGATPAPVDPEAWSRLVDHVPELSRLEDDVQALLVHRLGTARHTFIVPIDRCYELVGRLRVRWRGISGGDEVRSEIADFFRALHGQEAPHA